MENNMQEITMEEMQDVGGGQISIKKRRDKRGWTQYQVETGDTLIKIAKRCGVKDWHKIIEWNPHIDPKTNMIRTGEWLWIKQ